MHSHWPVVCRFACSEFSDTTTRFLEHLHHFSPRLRLRIRDHCHTPRIRGYAFSALTPGAASQNMDPPLTTGVNSTARPRRLPPGAWGVSARAEVMGVAVGARVSCIVPVRLASQWVWWELGHRARGGWARWSLKRHPSDIGVSLHVVSVAWQVDAVGVVGVMPSLCERGCSARGRRGQRIMREPECLPSRKGLR